MSREEREGCEGEILLRVPLRPSRDWLLFSSVTICVNLWLKNDLK
jgi:hypothetical protein